MNKKILLLLAAVPLMASCDTGTAKQSLIDLKDNEVFHTSTGQSYRNMVTADVTPVNIEYVQYDDYKLMRSTTQSTTSFSVYYAGYYYYLNDTKTNGNHFLGNITEVVTKKYSYLSYGQGDKTFLKETITTERRYSFESQMLTFTHGYTLDLNNLFATELDFSSYLPDLYATMNKSAETKKRVTANPITTVQVNKQTFADFCYIDTSSGELK